MSTTFSTPNSRRAYFLASAVLANLGRCRGAAFAEALGHRVTVSLDNQAATTAVREGGQSVVLRQAAVRGCGRLEEVAAALRGATALTSGASIACARRHRLTLECAQAQQHKEECVVMHDAKRVGGSTTWAATFISSSRGLLGGW